MKPVIAWAIEDSKGNLVTETAPWGISYIAGKTKSDAPIWNDGERRVRVEIREFTRPRKVKRK